MAVAGNAQNDEANFFGGGGGRGAGGGRHNLYLKCDTEGKEQL